MIYPLCFFKPKRAHQQKKMTKIQSSFWKKPKDNPEFAQLLQFLFFCVCRGKHFLSSFFVKKRPSCLLLCCLKAKREKPLPFLFCQHETFKNRVFWKMKKLFEKQESIKKAKKSRPALQNLVNYLPQNFVGWGEVGPKTSQQKVIKFCSVW